MKPTNNLTSVESEALNELSVGLRQLLGDRLLGMFLFGSKARGDYDEDSDLDIAIIVKGLDSTLKRAIYDVVAEIELKYLLPISSLALSSEQFEFLRNRERRIALDIEREGIRL